MGFNFIRVCFICGFGYDYYYEDVNDYVLYCYSLLSDAYYSFYSYYSDDD